MTEKKRSAITPTRNENYAEWYQEVVKAADLAEHSPVRGCMVIKPWGYGIWENIQKILDKMIKKTGHQNLYFPLLIPLSFFEKEAKHVEGFAKECAIVTHHRLEKNQEGKLVPAKDAELEEPLIVRPTSEMIIGEMFSKWVKSYRDLPILINQWANIVRWEMRTRMFLRTTEFLWQEGHTAHATKEEAHEETLKMLDLYAEFCREYLAMPVIKGKKPESEKFPGADITYSIEAMMQDKKALQAGTSHFLGQNFAKSSNIKFTDENSNQSWAWTTSWGVTTRLIGALIMTHSDDDGAVIPPKIAAEQIVLLPIIHNPEGKNEILSACDKIKSELEKIPYAGSTINVVIDKRDLRGGEKKWQWIKKGIPLIVEIGKKELENDSLFIYRRDDKTQKSLPLGQFVKEVANILNAMHENLLKKAEKLLQENTKKIRTEEEFRNFFASENSFEMSGGFAKIFFCQDPKIEEKLKQELSVTIRSLPSQERGKCCFCDKQNCAEVIFAKAY